MSVTYIPAALRKLVYERAGGCCEYCLMPDEISLAAHQIDHIIAEKHGGLTVENNLALSCTLCNKRKGSDIASVDDITGAIVPLFNPRTDAWKAHFEIENDFIIGLTANGRATVKLLQLNDAARVTERKILDIYK